MNGCRKGMLIASAAASLLLSGAVVARAADAPPVMGQAQPSRAS